MEWHSVRKVRVWKKERRKNIQSVLKEQVNKVGVHQSNCFIIDWMVIDTKTSDVSIDTIVSVFIDCNRTFKNPGTPISYFPYTPRREREDTYRICLHSYGLLQKGMHAWRYLVQVHRKDIFGIFKRASHVPKVVPNMKQKWHCWKRYTRVLLQTIWSVSIHTRNHPYTHLYKSKDMKIDR